MQTGVCALTGTPGKFVRAHILPQALTYGAAKGLPFAQAGQDSPPIKRWTSWYDQSLVTQEGEAILSEYDNWGIEELRRLKLVWSSWGEQTSLPGDFHEIPEKKGWGARKLVTSDPTRLRLFFLSLLWRAGASQMSEFDEIAIRASDLRRLKIMLVNRDPAPYDRFPVMLTQLSTKGGIHNLTPLSMRKPLTPWCRNGPSVPIFRFYLDGLVAHFHRETKPDEVVELSNMFVGNSEEFGVTVLPFENSWQQQNMATLIRETEERWPDRLSRIPGFERSTIEEP
jgi:hypothetical protein